MDGVLEHTALENAVRYVPTQQSSDQQSTFMDPRAQKELLELFHDAVRVGGAALEMRVRRFASLVRASDAQLADAITPLVTGVRALRGFPSVTPAPVDADTKLPLARIEAPDVQRSAPVLHESVQRQIDTVIKERQAADSLAAAGLTAVRSVLMSGPPGVGKTMTASWLASALELPLVTLDLASVMSSYLGRTGANVRSVLAHAQQEPCVLLLDEFDAIAKRRDDEADVGELKRLVTVILQAIDDWTPQSLLVAATNHGELLDPAVWRRFDVVIAFPLPTIEQRLAALRSLHVPPQLAQVVAALSEGHNMSALVRAVESARKETILSGRSLDEALLSWASAMPSTLSTSARAARAAKRDAKIFLLHLQGKTAREIAEEMDVSHTTVLRAVKALKPEGIDGRT
jgi:SpoVK/Ycf46/Vps4 family AAA+-type ATPase